MRSLYRLGLALTAAALLSTTTLLPATADPTESPEPATPTTTTTTEPTTPSPSPEDKATLASVRDVDVAAKFDKPSYRTGEKMTITLTVRNPTTEPMSLFANLFSLSPDAIRVTNATDFEKGMPFPLAAGASVTHTVTGSFGNPDLTTATLYLVLSEEESGVGEEFTFTTPIVLTVGQVSGVVFEDANDNGRFDDGEGIAGATLTFNSSLHTPATPTVTTNARGEFTITVPTGPYFVSGKAPNGLLVAYQNVTVDESGVDGLRFRATRPLTDLTVDLEFTKEVYGKDEAPSVRVTLTNKGNRPLAGIIANCNRSGEGAGLWGNGPGWGALVRDGVTVPANSTKVLTVTEAMPKHAYDHGRVWVGCDFAYVGVESDSNPEDYDFAKVPGMRGDITGTVADNGVGLAGVRVVMVADDHCPIVAEATTDAQGFFAFRQVPVGDYQMYLFPPSGWRIEYSNPSRTRLVGAGPAEHFIEVAKGDAALPTLPQQPADCAATPTTTTTKPVPQGSTAPELASTGASVFLPGVIGLVAMLAGAAALLVSRRRKGF